MVLQLSVFMGLLIMELSLAPLPVLGTLSFLLGCPAQSCNEGPCLLLFYLVCGVHLISLEACSFLKGKGEEVDFGEKGRGEKHQEE